MSNIAMCIMGYHNSKPCGQSDEMKYIPNMQCGKIVLAVIGVLISQINCG